MDPNKEIRPNGSRRKRRIIMEKQTLAPPRLPPIHAREYKHSPHSLCREGAPSSGPTGTPIILWGRSRLRHCVYTLVHRTRPIEPLFGPHLTVLLCVRLIGASSSLLRIW